MKEKQRRMKGLNRVKGDGSKDEGYPEIKSFELVRDKSLFLARRELGRSIFMGIIAISYREMVITITRLMRESRGAALLNKYFVHLLILPFASKLNYS